MERFWCLSLFLMMSIAVKVDGVVMKAAVLAFHAAIFIFCLVLSGRKIVLNQKYFSAPFFIWLVLVVVSVLRGEGVAAYALLLTYFFVALYLAYSNFRVSVSDYVFRGIFIVVSMDFLLMCAGVVSHLDYINGGNYGDALLLRAVGITHERVLPFFATGFQSYAILAGALILYLVSDFFQRRRLSFFSATGILISSVMLLVTDARGAVLYLLISLVLSLVFSRRFKGVVSISSGRMSLVLIFALMMPLVMYFMNSALVSMEVLSRGAGGILSGRDYIWDVAYEYIVAHPADFIFGLGYAGHKYVGVMDGFIDIFQQWDISGDAVVTLHNTWLQMFFDIGVVGVVFFLAMIRRFYGSGGMLLGPALVGFFVFLSAATDVIFMPYNILGIVFFVFYAFYCIDARGTKKL